jgi:DMSO/TMAO reductase YedYZ molybdopterin-dependent catalytic subunit
VLRLQRRAVEREHHPGLPAGDVFQRRRAAGADPSASEHGGPARLLVPHLYFWKSAKWLRGLTLTAADEPGLWETNGYDNYGDPWQEQRHRGD